MDEQPRLDANDDERAFSLTVEEALLRYEAAGHARTARALQKYCARGDLESQKVETTYGERYLITPASIDPCRVTRSAPMISMLPHLPKN